MATPEAFAPVAITRRSGFDESVHFGAVVGLSAGRRDRVRRRRPDRGDLSTIVEQADAGGGDGARRAAACRPSCWRWCAPATTARPRTSTRRVGSWRPPASTSDRWPTPRTCRSTAQSAEAVLRAGGGPTPLQMNCSGKHSGMLVTSAVNGWPTTRRTCRPIIRCSSRSPRRSTSSPASGHRTSASTAAVRRRT